MSQYCLLQPTIPRCTISDYFLTNAADTVQSITVWDDSRGQMGSLQINSLSPTVISQTKNPETVCHWAGCWAGSEYQPNCPASNPRTLSMSASQRVSKVQVWSSSQDKTYTGADWCPDNNHSVTVVSQIVFVVAETSVPLTTTTFNFGSIASSFLTEYSIQYFFAGFKGCGKDCIGLQQLFVVDQCLPPTTPDLSAFTSSSYTSTIMVSNAISIALSGNGQTIATSPSCPTLPIQYQITDISPTPLDSSLITFSLTPSSTQPTILMNPTNDRTLTSSSIQYTYTMTVTYQDPTQTLSSSATGTFKYFNPCSTTTFPSFSVPNQTIKLFESLTVLPSIITAFSSSKGSSSELCGAHTWSIQSVPASTFLQIDPSSGAIVISPTSIGDVDSYQVTVTIKLAEYCPSPASCVKQDKTFNVLVSCAVQSLTVVQQSDGGGLSDQSATLGSAFNYDLKTVQVPNCAFSVTSFAISSDLDPISQSTASGYALTAASIPITATNLVSASPHIVYINSVTLSDGSTFSTSQNFKLMIHHPCEFTVITSQTIGPISFAVFDGSPSGNIYGTFPEFTDSAGITFGQSTTLCERRLYSVTIGQSLGGQSLSIFQLAQNGNYFIAYSGNMNQIGTYTASLTISLQTYSTISKTISFQVLVNDPCPNSQITIAALNPLITSVLAQQVTQQIYATDSISSNFGSGSQLCGLYTFSISSTALTSASALLPAEINVDATGLINLSANSNSQIGTISIIVQTKLASYSSVTPATSTFTLTVQPCIVINFSFIPNPLSIFYAIFSATNTQIYTDAITLQTPLCGYDVDFFFTTLSPTPPTVFIVAQTFGINQISLDVESLDRQNQGSYNLLFGAQLNSYTYPQTQISNSISLNLADPCFGTMLIPVIDPIEDLVAFEGFYTNSLANYTYSDSVSDAQGFPSPICGPQKYEFTFANLPLSSQIEISNYGQITFQPTLNTLLVNQKVEASLTISLKLYPLFQYVQKFFVTTLSCEIQPIQDVAYAAGSGQFLVHYEDFKVTPTYAPTDLVISYESLLLSDSDGEEELPPFIVFNPSEKDWQISAVVTGTFNILLQSSFDQFPGAHCRTKFKISVTPSVAYLPNVLSEPRIDISAQRFFVEQCELQKNTTNNWNMTLPLPYSTDANATITSEKVIISSPYLAYNPILRLVYQTQFVAVERTDVVKIELSDSNGFSGFFTFSISFGCPSTNPNLLKAMNYNLELQALNRTQQSVTARIDQIMFNGTVIITFNASMKVPDNTTRIKTETVVINETVLPILDIKVIPGKLSEPRQLFFTWKLQRFTPQSLVLDLDFETPEYVSIRDIKDMLEVTIYGFYLFADIRGNFVLPEYTLAAKRLPLIVNDEEYQKSQQLGSLVTSATTGFFASSFVVSMLLAGVLQQILASVKQLQIQTHLMLFQIAIPVNAQVFYSFIMQVVALDYLNFDSFLQNSLGMDDSEPLTESFNVLGYSSLFALRNFGSLVVLIFGPPILAVLLKAVVTSFNTTGYLRNLEQTLIQKVFFNGILDFLNETYILLCMACFLNTFQFQLDTIGHAVNSLTCVLFGLTVLTLPIFIAYLYHRNFQLVKNRDKTFMNRYGGLLQDLNYFRNGQSVILYRVLTMVRKLLLASTCVYLQSSPVFSIISVNFQTLGMIAVVGLIEPFIQKQTNRLELINEAFTLLINYHLICFTDFVADPSMRKLVGLSLIYTSSSNILINLGLIVAFASLLGARKLKMAYLKLRQRIQVKAQLRKRADNSVNSNNFKNSNVGQQQRKNQVRITFEEKQRQFQNRLNDFTKNKTPVMTILKELQSQNFLSELQKDEEEKSEIQIKSLALKSCLKKPKPQNAYYNSEIGTVPILDSFQSQIQIEDQSQLFHQNQALADSISYSQQLQVRDFSFTQQIEHIQSLKRQGYSFDPNQSVAVDFSEIEPGLFQAQQLFESRLFDLNYRDYCLSGYANQQASEATTIPLVHQLNSNQRSMQGNQNTILQSQPEVTRNNRPTDQAKKEFDLMRSEQMIQCLRRR